MQKQPDLGTAPVGKLLARLALPAITAQVVNMLYNLVDRIYIGHIPTVGTQALTGVGVCFPLIMLVSAFAALVYSGGAPRASIAMGKGENAEAEAYPGQLHGAAAGPFGDPDGGAHHLEPTAAAALWRQRGYHPVRGTVHEHLRPRHAVCAGGPGTERLYYLPGIRKDQHAHGAHGAVTTRCWTPSSSLRWIWVCRGLPWPR